MGQKGSFMLHEGKWVTSHVVYAFRKHHYSHSETELVIAREVYKVLLLTMTL